MSGQSSEQSIFLHAIGLPSPADRPAYLDDVCRDNPALRAELEVLLAANDRLGGLSPTTGQEPGPARAVALGAAPSSEAGEEVGALLSGRYKLLEPIGEGGMGSVWMAQQIEPIRRLVALKVIKPGMDSKQVLARFEAERQTLALMEHPNIARVLDAGTTAAGRPYFVMELVKGVPITCYCDEQRLTPRERLELFLSVCQAVQHAHQKGIIHRDIKPSNVLVARYDGKPVPKVIDFGIAKATGQQLTDKTLVTGFGAIVGTLEYMSPEQAEFNALDIDTRSDLYSLGVLLYELLTGSTPLDWKRLKSAAILEVLRLIREEEPPRPSTRLSEARETLPAISAQRQTEPARLAKLVRGELDWIVMKALEKDRNRRYESANGLAQDVQRYLADEPVLACPPSAAYRLGKAVRRHKAMLAATGLVVLFLTLLGGGAGWVFRDRAARQAQAAHDLELALERAELFQTEGKRAESLAALEQAELLSAQAPRNSAWDERLADLQERLAAEARDQVFLARFETIQNRVKSQVDIQRSDFKESASVHEISDALRQYGLAIGAQAPAEAAARIQGRPEPVRRVLLAAIDEYLRWVPAKEAQRPWLLAVLQAADSNPWRTQVRQAAARADWTALEQLARKADVGKQPPSFLLYLAAMLPAKKRGKLELLRRAQRAYPADLWINHTFALGLAWNGQHGEAVRYYTAALALRPDNPGIYLNRGKSLTAVGELDAAIADYHQVLALAPNYSVAHHGLGNALRDKGRLDEAIAEYRKAILLKKDYPLAHYNLGSSLLATEIDHGFDEPWLPDDDRQFQEHKIITGRVLHVTGDQVWVDVGYKSEGIVELREWFDDASGEIVAPKPGDEVQMLLEAVEDESGAVVLSYRKAKRQQEWQAVIERYHEGDVVSGPVTRKIKGGLLVNIGVNVFLPASQVDVRRPQDIGDYIGKTIECKIVVIDEARRNIVVSRRQLLEDQRNEMKKKLLAEIEPGQIRPGTVKNIAQFGAFVDLGGIDGLLHITDMAWNRVGNPHEVVHIDQQLDVYIIKVDKEKEKIALGLKQKSPSPWTTVADKYPVASKHTGEVVNVMSYGAFVKLEPGVEGLVHISEMSWTRRINHPSEMVAIGDQIEVQVLNINKEKQEISLGMKQATPNPWDKVAERYPPNTVISGVVRNLTNYGAFIEIEEGIDGLLHVSDMSWVRKVAHPSEVVSKGDKVTCIVLNVDQERKRIALGLKQMNNDPWEGDIPGRYKPGEVKKGKVTKLTNFGVFVELEPGLEGLLHISELADHKVESPEDVVKVGDELEVKVLRVDAADRKLGLSRKRLHEPDVIGEEESDEAAAGGKARERELRGGTGASSAPLFSMPETKPEE